MKKYVLGFWFSEKFNEVLLIKRTKEDWQKDLLNGIGGSIEPTDYNPLYAMRRECKEETGIEEDRWIPFCKMWNDSWDCDCFYHIGFIPASLNDKKVKNEGVLKVCKLINFNLESKNVVSNLFWLIPLAFDRIFCENNFYKIEATIGG